MFVEKNSLISVKEFCTARVDKEYGHNEAGSSAPNESKRKDLEIEGRN